MKRPLAMVLAATTIVFVACETADEPSDLGATDEAAVDPGVPDDSGAESGCLPDPDVPADPGAPVDPGTLPDPGAPTDPGVPTDPGAPTDDGPETAADPGETDVEVPEDAGDSGGDVAVSPCPADMVWVESVCMDRYEASRPDATATSFGSDGSRATSRAGVLPWHVQTMNRAVLDTFALACANADKRLCTADEFLDACEGPNGNTYFFGNTWDVEKCNCVDTFCDDWCASNGISPCNTGPNCGYTYGCFHVVPTGDFPECTNEYGLFDINGNVWEIVVFDDTRGYQVRGGAYNCAGAIQRLQCGFNATWDGLMAGFRCCKDPGS